MRIFFAGVPARYFPVFEELDVKNALMSYASPGSAEVVASQFGKRPDTVFLLDSGAFSVWRSGKEIDLKAYIDFSKDFIARHGKRIRVHIVNLDVIPGVQGLPPTKAQIEDAAAQGWDNMLQMERAGITPLHIFHQGEDFSWLEKLAARHRYIGISPSNDMSTKSKHHWLRRVYSIIRANNMTHGFGVTAPTLMKAFPWYSVDSTSYLAPEWYGKAVFSGRLDQFDAKPPDEGLSSRTKSHVRYVVQVNIKELLRLQRLYTNLWAARGVTWPEDRA